MSVHRTPLEELFAAARPRGLYVELVTDHRHKSAQPPDVPPPRIVELRLTNVDRRVRYRTPCTLATVHQGAELALREIAR